MFNSRLSALAVLVAVVFVVSGCVPEPGPSPRASSSSPSPAASSSTSGPSATQTPTPTATPSPTDDPVSGVPGCWTVPVPNVAVSASQTPDEFAQENPGLIQSGAPAPCSIFADGAQRAAADEWIQTLVSAGWQDQGTVEDEVYVSRSATRSDGQVASFLLPVTDASRPAVTQFQTYRP